MEQQAERGAVCPVKVVDDQDQCPVLREAARSTLGILLEDLVLTPPRQLAALPWQPVRAANAGGELLGQLALGGGGSDEFRKERNAGDEKADQVGADREQGLARDADEFPEASGVGRI